MGLIGITRHKLKGGLPPLPDRMKYLPVSESGYPIPFFVHMEDDKPNFTQYDPRKFMECQSKKLCWVCGEKLGSYHTFVVGPLALLNRVCSDPPSHLECAQFACEACPHMLKARVEPEGAANDDFSEKSGVVALWTCRDGEYSYFRPQGASHKMLIFLAAEPLNMNAWNMGKHLQFQALLDGVEGGLTEMKEWAQNETEREEVQNAAAKARALVDRFWARPKTAA